MKWMNTAVLAIPVFAVIAAATAPIQFDDVEYIATSSSGERAKAVRGTLMFDPDSRIIKFAKDGATQFEVPYGKISSLVYERAASPRYAAGMLVAWPLLFTKTKKHFLTIEYKNPEAKGAMVFLRLDKHDFQTILATAESQTGVKLERHEE